MTIGERIRERRIELGLSQQELAEKMGYKTRAAISSVEKGKEDLTSARVRKYASALGVSVDYLIDGANGTQFIVSREGKAERRSWRNGIEADIYMKAVNLEDESLNLAYDYINYLYERQMEKGGANEHNQVAKRELSHQEELQRQNVFGNRRS